MLTQEVETFYLIPAIRKALVKLMVEKGLQKKDICEKLKITKSAISQYLSNKRGRNIKIDKEILVKTSENIVQGKNPTLEIQKLIQKLKETKKICQIYEENNIKPDDCEVCNSGKNIC